MEGFVSIGVYTSEIEAELAQATLAAAGIESFLKVDDSGGMLPVFQQSSGVKILVSTENADEAKLVLNSDSTDSILP